MVNLKEKKTQFFSLLVCIFNINNDLKLEKGKIKKITF